MHSTVHCSGVVQIFDNEFLKINLPKLGIQIDHSITRSLIYGDTVHRRRNQGAMAPTNFTHRN